MIYNGRRRWCLCVFLFAFIGQFWAPVSPLMLLLLITDQRGELDFVLRAGRIQPLRTETCLDGCPDSHEDPSRRCGGPVRPPIISEPITFLLSAPQGLCSEVRARRRGVSSVLKLCQKLLQVSQNSRISLDPRDTNVFALIFLII